MRVDASGSDHGVPQRRRRPALGFTVLLSNNAPFVTGDDYAVIAGHRWRSHSPSRSSTSRPRPQDVQRPACGPPRVRRQARPPRRDRHGRRLADLIPGRGPPTPVGGPASFVPPRTTTSSSRKGTMARTAVTVETLPSPAPRRRRAAPPTPPTTTRSTGRHTRLEEFIFRFTNTFGRTGSPRSSPAPTRPRCRPARATSTSPPLHVGRS